MGRVFRMECDQCDYYTEEDEPKDWIRIQEYCYSDNVFNTWYFCSWGCISEFAAVEVEKQKKRGSMTDDERLHALMKKMTIDTRWY